MPDQTVTPEQLNIPAWKCKTCGCLWRDNLDQTVSLFDAQQKSCAACEHSPTADACEIHWLALSRLKAQEAWQDISSYVGKRDVCDPVLVADASGYVVEAYYSVEHDAWWELNSEDDGAPGNDRRVYPTHWRPLPPAPADSRE